MGKRTRIYIRNKIGAPLKDSLPSCTETHTVKNKFTEGYKVKTYGDAFEPCHEEHSERDGSYKFWHVPEIIPVYDNYLNCILVIDGKAEGMHLTYDNKGYSRVKAMFIEKYGNPTKFQFDEYRNNYGNKIKGEVLLWEGKKLFIVLREYADRLDLSIVRVETNYYFEHEKQLKQKKISEDVGKL
jgi:hypothetical protein